MSLLPCQEDFLESRRDATDGYNALRIYRCEIADELCIVSGVGIDAELLLMVCDDCESADQPSVH